MLADPKPTDRPCGCYGSRIDAVIVAKKPTDWFYRCGRCGMCWPHHMDQEPTP